MADSAALRGFPADEALWRLLRLKGQEGGLQALRDAHPGLASPEAMAAPLEAAGIQARPALLEGGDLRYLEFPTLLELQDRSWVILDGFRRGRFQLTGPEGAAALPREALWRHLSGRALDLSPGLPPGAGLWARLTDLFLARRKALLPALAATLLLQLLGLASPMISAAIMDRALPDRAEALLLTVAAGLALAALHQVWLSWLRDRILLFVATRIEASAERGFFEHLLRCPFPFLQGRTLGEFSQAFGGFKAARELLPVRTLGAALNAGLALGSLGLMFYYLPGPAALIAGAALVQALATWLAGRAEARLEARQVAAQVLEQGLLIELVSGIAALKAAGAEARGLERWRRRFEAVLALARSRSRINLWFGLGMGALGQAMTITLLAWGGQGLLRGTLSVGRLFAFLQLANGFSAAVMGLAGLALGLMVLKPQLAKAQEILAVEPEAAPARPAPAGPVPVLMEDVWFRYAPDRPWILEGFQLRLEPGEQRTLDGPSGCGKTTILRLLAGLHEPERGAIRIAGRKPKEARHAFAYLPQFPRICGGSVLDNLRVFSRGAPLERLLEASRETGLQALVDSLPMGYQTLLPPGGGTLSGGQRQLIALTGAVASGRRLLLLDEPLANLDPARAAHLRGVLAGREWTVLAASHMAAE